MNDENKNIIETIETTDKTDPDPKIEVSEKEKRQHKDDVKKDRKLDKMIEGQEKIIKGLNTVGSALTKLVELQSVPKEEKTEEKPGPAKGDEKKMDDTYPETYIPKRYREICDEVLSPDFGIRVTDFDDRMDFQLDIIVPDEYSSISVADRENKVEDIRTKIISRSLGENGVREWCKRIRDNLNRYFIREGKASPFK